MVMALVNSASTMPPSMYSIRRPEVGLGVRLQRVLHRVAEVDQPAGFVKEKGMRGELHPPVDGEGAVVPLRELMLVPGAERLRGKGIEPAGIVELQHV